MTEELVTYMATETMTGGDLREEFLGLGYRPEWSKYEIRTIPPSLAKRAMNGGAKLTTDIPGDLPYQPYQAGFESLNRVWVQTQEERRAIQRADNERHQARLEAAPRIRKLVKKHAPDLASMVEPYLVQMQRQLERE